MIREPGSNTRKLSLLKAGLIIPQVDLTWNIQNWSATNEFITNYCIKTAEGARTAVDLRYTDGTDNNYVDNVLIDRFSCSCRTGGSILCRANGPGVNIVANSTAFANELSQAKSDWQDATVKIAGGTITNWLNWEFRVNNNTEPIQVGVNQKPSSVIEKQAEYSGIIRLARDASASKLLDVLTETKPASIAYLIADNQGSPVTKTFTFTSPLYRVSSVEMTDLNLTIEQLTWEGDSLTTT